MLARNWAAGRIVRNAPAEMLEFVLLDRFGGYTAATLDDVPAVKVHRWLAMIEAEAGEAKKRQQHAAASAKRKRR